MYAKIRELPESVRRALESVRYGAADIEVIAAERVSPSGASGSGMRAFVVIVDLATGECKHMQGSWGGSNMFNPQNQVDLDTQDYPIPAGVAVVKGSTGYPRTFATLYLAPQNMAKLLPAPIELDARDQWILYTFDGLNSRGRRDEWDRERDPPSEADLNRLAARGLLKRSRNGATQITTKGKNALGRRGGQRVPHPRRLELER
jgi:hypothetical protein